MAKVKSLERKTNDLFSTEKHITARVNKTSFFDSKQIGTDYSYKHEILWKNALVFLLLHLVGAYGAYVFFTVKLRIISMAWALSLGYASGLGTLIAAHRYFTHRCYKVKPFLRATYVVLQTLSGQNSLFTWCRDHRLHHRYTDTDADPHNSRRGFFFSHMGWLMMKKHPSVREYGKRIDMTDLTSDWMVMLQKKYFPYMYFVISIVIPVWVPIRFFGEPLFDCFAMCYAYRYILTLHFTWLVNSAAHIYGTRPYDKSIQPVENRFVSFLTLGEGWHNYHHTFPWDYKAAELPFPHNGCARIIELFASLGWAYDLKTASPEMIKNRILRTGDGTHHELGYEEAKAAVTAVGIVHPLNPTYSVTYQPKSKTVSDEGLPLFHENDQLYIPEKRKPVTDHGQM